MCKLGGDLEKFILVTCLLAYSGFVAASDPTPLFAIFIAWPLLAISLLFFIVALLRAKNSLFVNLVLLSFHFLVIVWATDVGYMKAGGDVVLLSLIVNFCSIVYWFAKNKKNTNNGSNT
jgi:hypothetical protein